jgi:response regulator RpfG family c-di-GMP phosphodiesterase
VKLYIKCQNVQNGPKTRSVILGEGIHMTDDNKIISIVGEELGKAQVFDDSLRTIKGIKVLKFTDPVVALEHLKINKDDYALMISDLRMPVINGLQLLTTVKDLNPSAGTVLTTDFEYDNKLIQECTNRHIINGFIQKPVEPHELVTEINKQIDIIESTNKK